VELQATCLDGLRALLYSVITLLFEQVRRSDDLVVALLDGAPSWRGGVRLPTTADLQSALTQLDGDGEWAGDHTNAITTWLTGLAAEPLSLLRQRLKAWQDRQAAGNYDEWYTFAERPAQLLQTSKTLLSLDQLGAHASEEDIVS
jgi:hypothetical protein